MITLNLVGQRHRRALVGSAVVDFWWKGSGIEVHWDPAPPRKWRPREVEVYRRELGAFVSELAQAHGGHVMAVEGMVP